MVFLFFDNGRAARLITELFDDRAGRVTTDIPAKWVAGVKEKRKENEMDYIERNGKILAYTFVYGHGWYNRRDEFPAAQLSWIEKPHGLPSMGYFDHFNGTFLVFHFNWGTAIPALETDPGVREFLQWNDNPPPGREEYLNLLGRHATRA